MLFVAERCRYGKPNLLFLATTSIIAQGSTQTPLSINSETHLTASLEIVDNRSRNISIATFETLG